MNTSKSVQKLMPMFENPFQIENLLVFEPPLLGNILIQRSFGVTIERLAYSLHGMPCSLVKNIEECVPRELQPLFHDELSRPLPSYCIEQARRQILDNLFWELVYWQIPDLYEELTEGEMLHPGIFQLLAREMCNKKVLDVGAGSGRATFECLRAGADRVYAVEPSPGLLRILRHKSKHCSYTDRVLSQEGRFSAVPLPDNSVDISLSCSAFTALPEQGGEQGLAELQRVTKPGGKVIFIWPRVEDHNWFQDHGFHYVSLPIKQEMSIHFRSLQSATTCARLFYARNKAVQQHVVAEQNTDIPFSLLGVNPPNDFYWRNIEK